MAMTYGILSVKTKYTTWNVSRYISNSQDDADKIPPVSKFRYILHDISREDAGRTEDMVMHKNRIGQSVELELGWSYLTLEHAHRVLTAFNDEYVDVRYHDPMLNAYRTDTFYIADRETPIYNHTLGLTGEFTITCISKRGDMIV